MIFGIGTDIIDNERVGRLAARGRRYLESIFTDREIEYCEGKARSAEHYAARFAAKEAALKALHVGWNDGVGFSDIEVLDDERGQPQVHVHGKAAEVFAQCRIRQASVSLSHSGEAAIAVIILET